MPFSRSSVARRARFTAVATLLVASILPAQAYAANQWRAYLLNIGKVLGGNEEPRSEKPTQPSTPAPVESDDGLEILNALDFMAGMEPVKRQLQLQYQQLALCQRSAPGNRSQRRAMHLAFVGQSGSGKTAVAKVYARSLHTLGVVSRPDVLQANRSWPL